MKKKTSYYLISIEKMDYQIHKIASVFLQFLTKTSITNYRFIRITIYNMVRQKKTK